MSDWLTLKELSGQYRAAAETLRARLAELRKTLNQTADPKEVWIINRRIAELTPLLTEMNALTELTEHYYDRGYYRDEQYTTNGIKVRFPEGTEKAKSNQNRAGGTYTDSTGYTHRLYSRGAVTERRSKRAGRESVDRVPNPEPGSCKAETVRAVSVAPDQLERLWSALGL